MSKGLFITIEGPDGSGKSTQISFIKKYFENKGVDVVFTYEPGGTKIGEQIRSVLLDKNNVEMSPLTEVLLYAAARAQHVAQVIKPALAEGKIVVCDRFIDSSIAYQVYGRELGDIVWDINKSALADCMPDLTLLFKLDPEIGLKRIEEKRAHISEKDRIELEKLDFHKKVLIGYLEIEKNNDRVVGIDANQSIEAVSESVRAVLDKLLLEKDRKQDLDEMIHNAKEVVKTTGYCITPSNRKILKGFR